MQSSLAPNTLTVPKEGSAVNNRFLIIARVSDQSHHATWLESGHPHFDTFLSYSGDTPNTYQNACTFYDQQKGERWSVIATIVEQYWELISTYEAIWFADETLLTNATNINRLFALFSGHQLALAHPAFTFDSHHHNALFLQHPRMLMRFTNGVDATAPIMSSTTLAQLHPTLTNHNNTRSLAQQWVAQLDNSGHNTIAIIDGAPVSASQPITVNKPEVTHRTRNTVSPLKIYSTLKISNSQGNFQAYLRAQWHKVILNLRAQLTRG
ncbi:hypothetical protein [Marinagarivorans algicola]|uniref:hypothetical protein n=1 Tax=Marinagarivorans algicola TaxID=1513270 RepID=UPI0006B9E507|nr:hypothetical protein [Marinagarivorans algicola]